MGIGVQHECVRPTYQVACPAGLFRQKTFVRLTEESQGNISFSASRKIRAGSVVIAWSWATALFVQTTAEPLNGSLGLSQTPEHTAGGEERRSVRPPCVCVCIWACLEVFLSMVLRKPSLAGALLLTLLIAGSWSSSVFDWVRKHQCGRSSKLYLHDFKVIPELTGNLSSHCRRANVQNHYFFFLVWKQLSASPTLTEPLTQSPHTVSALISTCLSATVNPQPITLSHAYKCLARAVKVAEGGYKSQEPFMPFLPHLSLLHPIVPPPSHLLLFLVPLTFSPLPFPWFPLKCHAREILSRMKEKTRGTVGKKKFSKEQTNTPPPPQKIKNNRMKKEERKKKKRIKQKKKKKKRQS